MKTIEDLELTSRTYGILKRGGINTVQELEALSLDTLLKFRNMGRRSLSEIERKLGKDFK